MRTIDHPFALGGEKAARNRETLWPGAIGEGMLEESR